ncbi:MAG: hypothetical protein M3Y48_04275 [Actinomycetota bacterium]|nr:hypothetical protein [Actinomycetota bacterium]
MKWNLGLFGYRRDTPESQPKATLVRGDDQTENVMEENVMETLNALVTIAPACAFCEKPVNPDQGTVEVRQLANGTLSLDQGGAPVHRECFRLALSPGISLT